MIDPVLKVILSATVAATLAGAGAAAGDSPLKGVFLAALLAGMKDIQAYLTKKPHRKKPAPKYIPNGGNPGVVEKAESTAPPISPFLSQHSVLLPEPDELLRQRWRED